MGIDVSSCRGQFPSLDLTVNGHSVAYFDGPGGTQVPRRVIDAVVRYYEECNANCHGEFLTSRRTDQLIADARQAVGAMLGAESPLDEIAFGANMTTLNYSLSRALGRELGKGDEIVITDLDHEANRSPWIALEERGVIVRSVRVNLPKCTLDYDDFERAVSPRTKIVALGYASNAAGTINDVKWASSLAHSVGAVCVVDAVHYAPHGPIDVQEIGCDFLLCSVYKFFGPHMGVLYGRKVAFERLATYKVRPQLSSPPHKIETGTLNHEGIAGTVEALAFMADLGQAPGGRTTADGEGCTGAPEDASKSLKCRVLAGVEAIELHERPLFVRLVDGLKAIPGVTVYGLPADDHRTPTVSFTVAGKHPTDVASYLGDRGVFVGSGDFYATRLIEVLGLAQSGGVVRAGISPYNTSDEIERLLEGVRACSSRALE